MDKKTKSQRAIKEQKVADLAEKIGRSKSITFANYQHLTAGQISQLRAKIKEVGGQLLVEKNSLIKLALTKTQLPAPSDQLTGPTAAILAYDDDVSPIKEVAKSNKDLGAPIFKFGFLGGNPVDKLSLEKLALIPNRITLEANLVGSLASPILKLVFVLSANMKNLVSVLDQIRHQESV